MENEPQLTAELLALALPLVAKAEEMADQRYRQKISETTSSSMKLHQANGKRVSHLPPFGWKVDPNDSARIVPDAGEQAALDKAKKLRDAGLSWAKVADQLTAEGFKPRPKLRAFKGRIVELKGKWHRTSLHRVLSKQK